MWVFHTKSAHFLRSGLAIDSLTRSGSRPYIWGEQNPNEKKMRDGAEISKKGLAWMWGYVVNIPIVDLRVVDYDG
jgi:hypothetical protein